MDEYQSHPVSIKSFQEYDNMRRRRIPAYEADNAWEISVMVDAHIMQQKTILTL